MPISMGVMMGLIWMLTFLLECGMFLVSIRNNTPKPVRV